MADSSHRKVVMNLTAIILPQIDRDLWELAGMDAEIGCPTGRHRFADLSLTRLPAVHAPHPRDREVVLLNPRVVFEVLSPSTRAVDLGDKPADYLSVPTTTDYLVVDPRRVWVQHRRRAGDAPGRWAVTTLEDRSAAVTLEDPAATLPLGEVYARVPVG